MLAVAWPARFIMFAWPPATRSRSLGMKWHRVEAGPTNPVAHCTCYRHPTLAFFSIPDFRTYTSCKRTRVAKLRGCMYNPSAMIGSSLCLCRVGSGLPCAVTCCEGWSSELQTEKGSCLSMHGGSESFLKTRGRPALALVGPSRSVSPSR